MHQCDFGRGPCKAQGCDCCTAAGHEEGDYNHFNYFPVEKVEGTRHVPECHEMLPCGWDDQKDEQHAFSVN